MAKEKQQTTDQLTFPIFQQRRFTLQRFFNAKLQLLADNLHQLTYCDLTWLTRVEEFMNKYDYLTEKQIHVIESIISRLKIKPLGEKIN